MRWPISAWPTHPPHSSGRTLKRSCGDVLTVWPHLLAVAIQLLHVGGTRNRNHTAHGIAPEAFGHQGRRHQERGQDADHFRAGVDALLRKMEDETGDQDQGGNEHDRPERQRKKSPDQKRGACMDVANLDHEADDDEAQQDGRHRQGRHAAQKAALLCGSGSRQRIVLFRQI